MQVGDLANDAITNTEIIGKTRPELEGVTIYEVDIFDKEGREREPDSINITLEETEIPITKTPTIHLYGRSATSGSFRGIWKIEGNKLLVIGDEDSRTATLAVVNAWTIDSVVFGNNVVTDVTLNK